MKAKQVKTSEASERVSGSHTLNCALLWPTGQQQLTVQNVSGNNLTISGLSPTQIQLQMEQALAGEAQPGEKRRRMACTCPNCKDGDKR